MDALGPWAEGCPELERAPVLLLAALVKEFFRALPQPLLAAELYPAWLHVLSKYYIIIVREHLYHVSLIGRDGTKVSVL